MFGQGYEQSSGPLFRTIRPLQELRQGSRSQISLYLLQGQVGLCLSANPKYMKLIRLFHGGLLLLLAACQGGNNTPPAGRETISMQGYDSLSLPERPNILWLVAEDLSPHLPAYGDSTVATPHLDRLAAEGVRYTRVFSPSGVCAPSRAALALGMYPTRTGAMHMRTGPWYAPADKPPDTWPTGQKIYEALPPEGTHMHSTYLRRAGYYATNNAKQDYQFRAELTAWDESSNRAHWRNRPDPDQPFFSIFNFGVTHESQIWARADSTLRVAEDLRVSVPPYLPDTEAVRTDLRRMYSNIAEMDAQVGKVLDQLEADGLLDKTIIFWFSDHGGMLPRTKRTLYDTGMQVPLLVRFPGAQLAGQSDGQLLSFVDFMPTLLSLARIPLPENLDGTAWMGTSRAREPRKYIHAAADDFDQCCHDRVRAVRDSRFKYVRNLLPDQSYYLPVPYREQMASMQEMLRLQQQGRLDSLAALWFRPVKDPEELFDTRADPFELHNLAGDPAYAEKRAELRAELDRWMVATADKGLVAEAEYLHQIWPDGKQPVTGEVEVSAREGNLYLATATKGADIGFQWLEEGEAPSGAWGIYSEPLPVQRGKILLTRAHRIGYLPGEPVWFRPN